MAEGTPPRQMSLVPYASENREIVLQQGNAVVVYDTLSRQLSVRSALDIDTDLDLTECPYCHRPLHETGSRDGERTSRHHERPSSTDRRRQAFVDPEYFSMLAHSQRPSPTASGINTPPQSSQRLFLPLRSGRSRDVSGNAPPSGAEFVASEPAPGKAKGISSSAFSPGYFKQFFREERELGRGGNGVVLLVEHLLDGVSLGQFACKRIPVGNDHSWLEKVLVEVKLLAQVPHKNLVKYHWVWVEEHQASAFAPKVPCVWILQEYCNGGDLQNHIHGSGTQADDVESLKMRHRRHSKGQADADDRRRSRLPLEEIFSFFRDITSGLHHLHSKGYIHRDVKPSNCLLQRDGGRTRVLLSDFGEVQAAGTRRGNTGATGTISYCAPEVLVMQRDGRYGNFTTKSDVFSLGMILYFMCFGRLPYQNADEQEENEDIDLLRAEITAWEGFDHTSRIRTDLPDRLYKFLQRLLSIEPSERPSTEEILDHIKLTAGLGESNIFDTTHRQPSPSKHSLAHVEDEQENIVPSGLVLRSRNISSLGDKGRVPSPQASPRLILPPPAPVSRWNELRSKLYGPTATRIFRILLFCVKMATLIVPCSPFQPRKFLLFPLLVLALLDLLIEPFDFARCAVFLVTHLSVMWTALGQANFCEGLSPHEQLMRHAAEGRPYLMDGAGLLDQR